MVCPTRWFLTTEAGGAGAAHQSANIGQLVHALAQRVAVGEVAPDLDLLMRHVDEVWGRLHFRTPWSAAREHDRIEVALTRFLEWHDANPRKLVATEERFETVVELESGETGHAVRLRRPPRARRRRPGRGGRPQDEQVGADRTRSGTSTSSSASTSTPSTTAPSTTWPRSRQTSEERPRRRARPARPARRRLGRGAAAAGLSPTTAPSAPPCGPSWSARRPSCGPRPSRPSPATTAATATSSRSARSRAPGR